MIVIGKEIIEIRRSEFFDRPLFIEQCNYGSISLISFYTWMDESFKDNSVNTVAIWHIKYKTT